MAINCRQCGTLFEISTHSSLTRKLCPQCANCHQLMSHKCGQCAKTFLSRSGLRRHVTRRHASMSTSPSSRVDNRNQEGRGADGGGHSNTCSALNNAIEIERLLPSYAGQNDMLVFLKESEIRIRGLVDRKLTETEGIIWYMCLRCVLNKLDDLGDTVSVEPFFRSRNFTTFRGDDLRLQYAEAVMQIIDAFEHFKAESSGWNFDRTTSLEITLVSHAPLRVSGPRVRVPSKLCNKTCLLNFDNRDDKCFLYCVLATLHRIEANPGRIEHYARYVDKVNLRGISFPTPINQMSIFERHNPNIAVNIFGYESGEVFPLRISPHTTDRLHGVNLLLLSDKKINHFCLIRNTSRLFRKKKHDRTKFFCLSCLHGFVCRQNLKSHEKLCRTHGLQKTVLPTALKSTMEFPNRVGHDRLEFVAYADFESIVEKSIGGESRHVPISVSYLIVSTHASYEKPIFHYRGKDCATKFVKSILSESREIAKILDNQYPIDMTPQDELDFQQATICYLCKLPLTEQQDDSRVRDHAHSRRHSNWRGACHKICNLQFSRRKRLACFFHNGKSYDFSFVLVALSSLEPSVNIKCLPSTDEKFKSLTVGNLVFLDSISFLNTSLQKLAENLASGGADKFANLRRTFAADQIPNLLQKMSFPYEYVRSERVLLENSLPPRDQFYSSLTEKSVSESEHARTQVIWTQHDCQNLGHLMDVYNKADVCLLADVFESFRSTCLESYSLDPANYVSLPSFSFQAFLKTTGVCFDLFTDPDMYLFVENSLRGGLVQVSQRFASANNKYMGDEYDPEQESSHIVCWDVNSLYGHAMCRPIFHGGGRWLTPHEISTTDFLSVASDSPVGYVMEVDLEYDSSLHELHRAFPCCPEKRKVEAFELSPFCVKLLEDLGLKPSKDAKLLLTLHHKLNYTVHYELLKTYVALGLKITKIHRVLELWQSDVVKQFVDFNSRKRRESTNSFDKSLYKLFVNSVFGKFLENVRNRERVHLVSSREKLLKLVAKPSFKSVKVFNENLVSVRLAQVTVTLNKPIYAGFAILELSKQNLYEFYYGYVMKKYGSERASLLYMDTDSFMFHIKTADLYRDLVPDSHLFDMSVYPEDHFLFDPTNRNIPGKLKDEYSTRTQIKEFCGLKAKLYSFLFANDHSSKCLAKGVGRTYIDNHLRHDMYRACLQDRTLLRCEVNQIRCKLLQIHTTLIKKVALNPYCDKRYILSCGIRSVPYGFINVQMENEALDSAARSDRTVLSD